MKLTIVLILAAVTFALSIQTRTAFGQRRTFEITASISPDSLKSYQYKRDGIFWVDTRIRNLTNKDQQIVVWSQSGWSWISDNHEIVPAIAAQQNVSRTVVIKPGQTYDLSVDVVGSPRTSKPITFRLGFYAKANLPFSGQPNFAKLHESEITWSNPLKLIPFEVHL